MRKKYAPNEKREIIIKFIKKNPNATYRLIRKKTKLHPERVFKTLKQAFEEAGVRPPRTFKKKTKEEKRRIIIDYIKKYPGIGGHIIRKKIKMNVTSVFDSIADAYEKAEVNYPRRIDKRTKEEKKKEILDLVKRDPLVSITEIISSVKTQPYRFFKNINGIYEKAGVKKIKGKDKRRIKKQNKVIEFIKQNPLATQREINKKCNTRVQDIFDGGIFEAYKRARIKFPFERLKLYGVGLEKVRNRAKSFEEELSIKLSGYGKVNRLVKTKRGFADIIFERKDKKIVIEIKDYQNKEISISQIKQLNRYLEDCNSNVGFLICRKKPKRDKFLIGKNKIFVLDESELNKIPSLIDGSVV
ncbi:hypothetical protein DRN69_02120 [Candidatus Pacearchaeota archaeon]|nr:MAG: hypothetical protein DRN69_02120 [Candidatus Pacearchaeota archaeon]